MLIESFRFSIPSVCFPPITKAQFSATHAPGHLSIGKSVHVNVRH